MPAYHRAPTTLITELAVADKQTPTVAFALGLVAKYRRRAIDAPDCLQVALRLSLA